MWRQLPTAPQHLWSARGGGPVRESRRGCWVLICRNGAEDVRGRAVGAVTPRRTADPLPGLKPRLRDAEHGHRNGPTCATSGHLPAQEVPTRLKGRLSGDDKLKADFAVDKPARRSVAGSGR